MRRSKAEESRCPSGPLSWNQKNIKSAKKYIKQFWNPKITTQHQKDEQLKLQYSLKNHNLIILKVYNQQL